MAALVSEVIFMMNDRAQKKGLYMNVNVNESMPKKLLGDTTRIKQIIINLVTNAIKYTDEGGVSLDVDYEKTGDDTILLKVKVSDTGSGMKPEDIDRIFDAFRRFDYNRNKTIEGTGLGMSIVKKLLDLMDGKLDITSTYGHGSEFAFSIEQKVMSSEPIGRYWEAIGKAIEEKEDYVPQFIAPSARILAVDDTEINLTVLKRLLKQTQVQLTCCISVRHCSRRKRCRR